MSSVVYGAERASARLQPDPIELIGRPSFPTSNILMALMLEQMNITVLLLVHMLL